ncbi:MAG: hypothetical protein QW498_09095 [Thermofilum sp.]
MTRLRPEVGSLKELRITMRTPKEELLSTPEPLPTTEPSTPQIAYTVSEEDLPVLSISVHRVIWVARVFVAGRFTTAGRLYLRMWRNRSVVSYSSYSVTANFYYTVNASFYNVRVGDVLELSLWSSVSDSVWDYRAFQIQPTRIIPHAKYVNLYNVRFSDIQVHPVLTLENPNYTAYSPYIYHTDAFSYYASSEITVPLLRLSPTYGLFQIYFGDYSSRNTAIFPTSPFYKPYSYSNMLPTRIRFRFLYLD